MVGLVIVSHSYRLAEGVKELAESMGRGKIQIAAAGGIDERSLGTNLDRIVHAIREVYSPDGVLALMDLGSAVLTTQLAVEMLPEDWRDRIRLSPAPLVEGAVAAASEAASGSHLTKVDEAACSAGRIRKTNEGQEELGGMSGHGDAPTHEELSVMIQCSLRNPLGLHARSAAQVVQAAQKYRSVIDVVNISRQTEAVNARSLMGLLRIGAAQGHIVSIRVAGEDAVAAAAEIGGLFHSGFGEMRL